MYDPTKTIRRLAAALFATAALSIAVPVAQGLDGPPDAMDRYLGRTSTAAPVVAVDDGFAWSEFGIGAGAVLGLVLLVAGLGLGALAMRHRSGTLRTPELGARSMQEQAGPTARLLVMPAEVPSC